MDTINRFYIIILFSLILLFISYYNETNIKSKKYCKNCPTVRILFYRELHYIVNIFGYLYFMIFQNNYYMDGIYLILLLLILIDWQINRSCYLSILELKEYSKYSVDYKYFTKYNNIIYAHPHFERLYLEYPSFYILLPCFLFINLFIVLNRININNTLKIFYALPTIVLISLSFKNRIRFFIDSL